MSNPTDQPEWTRLIRYVSSTDNDIYYGEPILPDTTADVVALAKQGQLRVKRFEGKTAVTARPGNDEIEEVVKELLAPLTHDQVPAVRCTGLNYLTHIHELNTPTPVNPTLFMKSRRSITSHFSTIPIPKLGQSHLDYEGELTILIGRDGKNIREDEALSYIAGYLTGNDISCRDWQMQPEKAGTQWCFSKSFDEYAPMGPMIVSPRVLGDGSGLRLTTKVNGEVRQDSTTSDLCFGVKKLVSFFSTGQTLEAGSVIMTGTPAGVGVGFKPPKFLKDGDEVEVEIEGIGKICNTMKFE